MKFRALIGLLLAALLIAAPAQAQKKTVVFTKQGWTYAGATIDLDFQHARYYSNGFVPDIGKYTTTTRATTSTDLLSTSASGASYLTYPQNSIRVLPGQGLLTEVTKTNFLLNSTAPATQTTGTLANGTYNLWVNGSGTATMSSGTATGCGTGVASQGTPIFFTLSGTTGTCTVTVAGSLNQFQLELSTASGAAAPTSFIPTAGATVFRNGDAVATSNTAIQTLLNTGTGTVLCTLTKPHFAIAYACFYGTSSATVDVFISTGSNGATFVSISHTPATITAIDGGATDPTTDKVAVSWDGSGRCIVWNGGSAVCDTGTFAPAGQPYIGNNNGARGNGTPIKRLTFWPTKFSTAQLQAITR